MGTVTPKKNKLKKGEFGSRTAHQLQAKLNHSDVFKGRQLKLAVTELSHVQGGCKVLIFGQALGHSPETATLRQGLSSPVNIPSWDSTSL